ncbi:MAG: hypothetical protein MUC50_12435 [Myxococcota bacterium]|jgi:hypothetical protein|nr:hypothetical protein [Myxococcota bacterium]
MLIEYTEKLERYLNNDAELHRRLSGFKTFSGIPDGHYKRARQAGAPAIARAVRCYPFGGKSQLDGRDLLAFHLKDYPAGPEFRIALADGVFRVSPGKATEPCLRLALPKELFKRALLGRYRWLWLFSQDEVELRYAEDLPHSDWVTVLEVLVAMQELLEFDPDLLRKTEGF